MKIPVALGMCGLVAVIAIACAGCTEPTPAVRNSSVAWQVRGVAGPGRPAVDDGTVYFLADADSHTVHAFDQRTGAPRWSAPTGLSGPGRFNNAGCAVSPLTVICGEGANVVGLDKTDGHLRWSVGPGVARYPGVYQGTVDSSGNTYFAPTADNKVIALDAATGDVRWSAPVIGQATGLTSYRVADGGDLVFVPYTDFSGRRPAGGMLALSKANGSQRWITSFSSPDSSLGGKDVALWRDLVLGSFEDGHVRAFDRLTGQVVWELPKVERYPSWSASPDGPVVGDYRTLIVVGDVLTVLSESGWVVTYDLPTRKEIGRATLNNAAPLLFGADGDARGGYFKSTTGYFFSYSAGVPSLSLMSNSYSFISPPAITADRVFIGSSEGYIAFTR
jgi:outer membrane protein assembly factor BamB